MPITSKFVCLNGQFIKEEELCFSAENRAFRYADGFFETMHYANGEIQLFDLHLKRMKKAMDLLKLESSILLNKKLIHNEIVHLINTNHFFKGARVRISIFRSGGGLYTPEENSAAYLIENWALDNSNYNINKQGLSIGLYSELKKMPNNDLFYKSLDARISVLASLYKKKIETDDCFLCNSELEIIESISSNAFFIKNNTLYTAGTDSGCVHGIMREKILSVASKEGFQIVEDAHIKAEHIIQFDEIFLSNAIKGIQWVGAYKSKRFDNKLTKQLQKTLVSEIFNT